MDAQTQALVRSINESLAELDVHLSRRRERNEKRAAWRVRLSDFLEQRWVHVVSLGLLLLDLVFTILDVSTTLLRCSKDRHDHDHESPYHWASIAILAALSAKSATLVVAYGTTFLRQFGHVVDAVVVVAALVLELAAHEAAGLVVVASLWRVVKLVDGVCELRGEVMEPDELGNVRSVLKILREKLQENAGDPGNCDQAQLSVAVSVR